MRLSVRVYNGRGTEAKKRRNLNQPIRLFWRLNMYQKARSVSVPAR
jgi:hypothetical protein